MSRRLAYRPRYSPARTTPRPLSHAHQDYLHQRWTYRQQRVAYPKRAPGYGISLVPWGWRAARDAIRRLA